MLQNIIRVCFLVGVLVSFGNVNIVEAIPIYPAHCIGVDGRVNDGMDTLIARGSGDIVWKIEQGDKITFESVHPSNPNLWDGLRLHVMDNLPVHIVKEEVDAPASSLGEKPTIDYTFDKVGEYEVDLDVFAARWIYWGTRDFNTLGSNVGNGPAGNRLGSISIEDSTCQKIKIVVMDKGLDDDEDEDENGKCISWDGDSWGWDGEKGCEMKCFDWDGDGWGWDGEKGCRTS
jgi:hypothetical protein